MNEAEHLFQLRPHQGRTAQLGEGSTFGSGEKLANRHPVTVRADRRIGGLEQVDENPHDLFRLVALEPRDATLLGERSRLQPRHDPEGRDAEDEHGGRGDREAVSPHELARPVPHRVGLSEHGVPTEEPFNLLTQLTRRRVTALGFLAQRRQDDAIEVAANTSNELARVGDACAFAPASRGSCASRARLSVRKRVAARLRLAP